MKYRLVIIILLFGVSAFGQKTVSDLDTKHAAVLADFLTKYKNYEFLSENRYDKEYLKFMRETYGSSLKPAYHAGDFNHDGFDDFAVIVIKKAPPVKNDLTAKPHNLEYQIALVIFNGNKKGTYQKAFFEEFEAPLACFISLTDEKKKRLYFGIAETDNLFYMKPSGEGYTVEYPDEP